MIKKYNTMEMLTVKIYHMNKNYKTKKEDNKFATNVKLRVINANKKYKQKYNRKSKNNFNNNKKINQWNFLKKRIRNQNQN